MVPLVPDVGLRLTTNGATVNGRVPVAPFTPVKLMVLADRVAGWCL